MANRRFTQFFYTLHNYPVLLDCNFVVTPTNGAGITSLKGPGIESVFMDTSTTPATGSPDPAAGYIYVNLQDNYKKFYGFDWDISVPVTGSAINVSDPAVMTVGVPYQIVTLGTTTSAQWRAVGVPSNMEPAVGMVFMAAITGGGTGTGTVKALGLPGISSIVLAGDPEYTLKASRSGPQGTGGGYLVFKCLAPSGTNSAPTFTGSALGTHAHDMLIKGGQAAASTAALAWYATDILGKEAATDATILGADSATKGGVIAASAGTPAGTVAAPTWTGSQAVTAPTTGSIIRLSLYLSNTRITNGNE